MKRTLCFIITIIMLFSMLPVLPAFAASAQEIDTKAEFLAMTENGNYKLTKDIDLGTLTGATALAKFSGTLDGNGKTVTYKTTTAAKSAGLIGTLTGTVINLNVNATVNLSGNLSYVGGVAAQLGPKAYVSNIYTTGSITVKSTGSVAAGGIAGLASGDLSNPAKIENCYNTINVTGVNPDAFSGGFYYLAGIAGYGAQIKNCANSGAVKADATNKALVYTAGITAISSGQTKISNCANGGDISSKAAISAYASGIIASIGRISMDTVTSCENYGKISAYIAGVETDTNQSMEDASAEAGGIVANAANPNNYNDHGEGYAYAQGQSQSIIRDCANTGVVSASKANGISAKSYAAGIVARTYGFVIKCVDKHEGTITADYAGPVFAALNDHGKLAGGIVDSYCATVTSTPVLSIGVKDNAYYSITEIDNADFANKNLFSALDFVNKWEIKNSRPTVKNLPSFKAPELHEHTFNSKDNDANGHWTECVCGEVTATQPHVYDNDQDATCNGCNYRRTVTPQNPPACTHKYDNAFDAKCNLCGVERTAPNTATRSFTDVKANAWFKYYVDYAVAYGLFSGTSDTTFSPNTDMTRAQFVQVLANLSGAKLNNNVSTGFSDAPAGKWFTGAVKWATSNGIASGVGNGQFNPTGKIDRQQMCMMLVNYVENYKKTTLKEKVSYKTFADDKEIAGWAKTAVIKCFKAGLVSGTGNNMFSPKVVANRATGATIFTNFHKEYIA